MDITLILIVLGAVLIIAELFIGIEAGLDLLLIGSCLLVGGLVGYFFGDNFVAIGTAGLLSVGYLTLGRSYVRNKMEIYTHSSNVDSLLGKTAKVKAWNEEKHVGEVVINSESWRISSDSSLKIDQQVKIVNIDGVTLVVKPA